MGFSINSKKYHLVINYFENYLFEIYSYYVEVKSVETYLSLGFFFLGISFYKSHIETIITFARHNFLVFYKREVWIVF